MAILDDLTKGPLPMLLGLGLVVAAPSVMPAVGAILRPLAKVVVKTGLTLFDVVKEGLAEAGEEVDDLVAETRQQMSQGTSERTPRSQAERMTTSTGGRRRRGRS